jgi:ATP-dependent Clp protease protease subunit
MLERVNRLIADATGQPVEKVKQDTDRNYWMNPQEAIDYGIVSRVVNSYGDLKLD